MKKQMLPILFAALAVIPAGVAGRTTRNVLLVTIDGLRWQEVFRGAEEALIDQDGGGVPANLRQRVRTAFWADTPQARRAKLMPFFWETIAGRGQAFGNRDTGSPARVLNAEWISYPGYNEILTGRPDPLIVSNTPIPNPNITVLEWLNGRPEFAGRVAAAAAWRVFEPILNVGRSRLPLFVTLQRSATGSVSPRIAEIEQWMDEIPPITSNVHFDAFVHRAALDDFDRRRPRVYLLGFGEPDEWAHQRRYDRYLHSIERIDRFLRALWERLQSLPDYRGSTSMILTTDHGRGVQPEDWTDHGKKTPRADETWVAAIGPDVARLGERRNVPEVHQAQLAATVGALLGEDFRSFATEAALPIADISGRRME